MARIIHSSVTNDQIEEDKLLVTNMYIFINFSSLCYTKMACSYPNKITFHYLKDNIVIFQKQNQLMFGKFNHGVKVKKKITSDLKEKLRSAIDLQSFPQIRQGNITFSNSQAIPKLMNPVTIECYFEYQDREYIILTEGNLQVGLYQISSSSCKFLETFPLHTGLLSNVIVDKNYIMHARNGNNLYQFNLLSLINAGFSDDNQITFKIVSPFDSFHILDSNFYIFTNGNLNHKSRIKNPAQRNEFNIYERIVSVTQLAQYTFILTSNHIHVHNQASISFSNNSEDPLVKMAIKQCSKYFKICTLSKGGVIDIYIFNDSIREREQKLTLEFRVELNNLNFFTQSNHPFECEYLNFIDHKKILLCSKSGHLLCFQPNLFFTKPIKL